MTRQPAIVQHALRPHAVELREVDIPTIESDDVLLEVGAVSVCGSDVHQVLEYPIMAGECPRRSRP